SSRRSSGRVSAAIQPCSSRVCRSSRVAWWLSWLAVVFAAGGVVVVSGGRVRGGGGMLGGLGKGLLGWAGGWAWRGRGPRVRGAGRFAVAPMGLVLLRRSR